ncbi:MAG: hypothetical protein OEZ06_17985 [Myxococcales bacterium]|nr:hypothetical protein [Myxococcales bacterium]
MIDPSSGPEAVEASAEEGGTLSRLGGGALRSISQLGVLSRELASGVSSESDRWLRGGLTAADRGSQKTHAVLASGFARVGRALDPRPLGRRLGWLDEDSPRVRIEKLLLKEARRAGLEAPEQQVQIFAGQMATLLGLVVEGEIPIDQIALEAEADAPMHVAPTEAPSCADQMPQTTAAPAPVVPIRSHHG